MTDFKAQLTAIFDLQPGTRLGALVKEATAFSPEEFRAALPSWQMGPDGPVLVRVTLVSESYIVDLHLASGDLARPGQSGASSRLGFVVVRAAGRRTVRLTAS